MAARSPPALDGGAAGQLDLHAQLVGDDVRERRLAQPGRAVQKDVVERLAAHLGGRDEDGEVVFDLFLPDVVGHRLGAEGVLLDVELPFRAHDQPLVRIFVKIVKIVHFYPRLHGAQRRHNDLLDGACALLDGSAHRTHALRARIAERT